MSLYTTIDYLPDLTAAEINKARKIVFSPYKSNQSSAWDNSAVVSGSNSFAILHDIYKFEATAGATYDIISTSYLDPFLLRLYDSQGNAIVANDEADDGSDFLLNGTYYSNDIIWDWVAPYTGTYYVSANWHQGNYYKFYALSLYEDVDTVPAAQTIFYGTNTNDKFTSTYRNETFYGEDGIDTVVFTGTRASHTLTKTTTGWNIKSTNDGSDTIQNVERLQFSNQILALDIDGIAGQAFRLYQAAFDRTPDNDGLKYWISQMDAGKNKEAVAAEFIGSQEFQSLYGANPSNADFLTKLYSNVLHRTPDQDGYNWWLGMMDSGTYKKTEVLSSFSESPENQAAVIGSIQNGIDLFL